jgi:hypothetical protein
MKMNRKIPEGRGVCYTEGRAQKPAEKIRQKPGRKTNLRENLGKVLVNLGQVVFATLFLGGVLRGEVQQYIIMIAGLCGTALFIALGLLLSAKEQTGKE